MFTSDGSLNEAAPDLLAAVRRELLRLADQEDHFASTEAAKVPYWSPCPASVVGRREAARALREDADRLLRRVA
jgi:hypothetical protein